MTLPLPLGFAETLADALWLALCQPLEVGCALEPGLVVLWPLLGDGVDDAEADDPGSWLGCSPPLEDVGSALLCGWEVTPGELVTSEDWAAEEVTWSLVVTGSEVGVAEPVSEVEASAKEDDVRSVKVGTAELESEMVDMMGMKIYSI